MMLCLAASVAALADSNGGSAYSRYGLGDIRYYTAGRGNGMAGAGLALFPSLSFDHLNPAGWGNITRARFSASALYEGFSSDDGIDSRYLSRTNLNGFVIALPVSPDHGITISAGMIPFSRVNYDIVTPFSRSGVTYILRYVGDGGISTAHLGASGKLGDNLFVGTKFQYYFGSVNHTVSQSFSTTDLSNAEVRRSSRASGIGFTFGTIYTGLKSLFHLGEMQSLQIGGIVSTTSFLSASSERIATYATGTTNTQDTTIAPEGTILIPYAAGAGIAFSTDRMTIAGDFIYQNWQAFTVDGAHPDMIRNSYRVSAGAELLPTHGVPASFAQKMTYRFGIYYDASYYQIRGEPINEWGLTGGFGIPVFLDTRLIIAADYGLRGTNAGQLQKDKILRISFTINISEPWFVRSEEE